ncbi:MAG: hypothetical protein OEO23_00830 [Gemmatimonadota bacterium]|nr:hypothetical protein [Gemmatimonadota bacterium]
MSRLVRSTLTATAALLFSVGPAWALTNCAPFVSGWYNGGPASGYLIGTSTVTITGDAGAFFNVGVSESFCVGTYQMMLRDGSTTRLKLRCDDYSVWGLF